MAAGTLLTVVLDEPIDARTASAGSLVKIHLEKPLELGGVTLAPAGSPGTLKIVAVRKPAAPDRDGSLEFYLEPLPLASKGDLPLRSERETFPSEVKAGSILRARTGAAIDATNPAAIAIVTPPPFVTNTDPIHSDFTPIPLFTIAPPPPKRPKATPAATASPSPSAAPTPGA
jgi:hypothetical protein